MANNTSGLRADYIDGTYSAQHPTWHIEDSAWKAVQIQQMLEKNSIQRSTICEVGCGAGEVLRQLAIKNTSSTLCGYELSPQAFEFCKIREDQRVRYFKQDLLDKDVHYDLLLCIDVFEHVENYMGFLRGLKPKASHHVFHVPLDITVSSVIRNLPIRARESLGHLHYFMADTALSTLKDCGYEVIDSSYTPAFAGIPPRSMRSRLAKLPRQLIYAVSPRLLARFLGGCSLLVLTR